MPLLSRQAVRCDQVANIIHQENHFMTLIHELKADTDFFFAIDVSASMQSTDCPGGLSRFDFCKEKTFVFANEAQKVDQDGISIYTFGQDVKAFPDTTPDVLDKVFAAGATECMTQTHLVIKAAYKEHLDRKNQQSAMFIVTDGAPTDQNAVKDVLRQIANEAEDGSFNMAF
jgi:Mg-chelatase subunit ChlD